MNPKEFESIQNLRLGLQSVMENFAIYTQLYSITAKAKREFFNSCLEEGFSKEEALALTCEFKPFGV